MKVQDRPGGDGRDLFVHQRGVEGLQVKRVNFFERHLPDRGQRVEADQALIPLIGPWANPGPGVVQPLTQIVFHGPGTTLLQPFLCHTPTLALSIC